MCNTIGSVWGCSTVSQKTGTRAAKPPETQNFLPHLLGFFSPIALNLQTGLLCFSLHLPIIQSPALRHLSAGHTHTLNGSFGNSTEESQERELTGQALVSICHWAHPLNGRGPGTCHHQNCPSYFCRWEGNLGEKQCDRIHPKICPTPQFKDQHGGFIQRLFPWSRHHRNQEAEINRSKT